MLLQEVHDTWKTRLDLHEWDDQWPLVFMYPPTQCVFGRYFGWQGNRGAVQHFDRVRLRMIRTLVVQNDDNQIGTDHVPQFLTQDVEELLTVSVSAEGPGYCEQRLVPGGK